MMGGSTGLDHGVGPPHSSERSTPLLSSGSKGRSGARVYTASSPTLSPRTAMLWPWTKAEAMRETGRVVALC